MTPLHTTIQERYAAADASCEALQEYQTPYGYLGFYRYKNEDMHLEMTNTLQALATFASASRL